MNTHTLLLKSTPLVIASTAASGVFSWFTVKYVPSLMVFFWLVIAVAGDLLTGLLKAWSKQENTTSTGFRRTVLKIGSYAGAIVAVVVLVNMIGFVDHNNKWDLAFLVNALVGFMVFVELYSILENISEAYPNSPLTTFFINPLMAMLKGKLSKFKKDNEQQDPPNMEQPPI